MSPLFLGSERLTLSPVIYLQEAVSVEFRDLSVDEIKLPDLPVRFDLINHRIEVMQAAHQDNKAAALSEAISKFRADQSRK